MLTFTTVAGEGPNTLIGKEGYSIIGQGQIDKILSGKPEERRELFDKAAGIVKFKKRKAAAVKKLEDEQNNLVRVNDILSELEKIASHYGFISKGHLLEAITSEELQNKCRKSLNVKVDNIQKAEETLRNMGLSDLKISPNGEIKIYDEVKIVDAVKNLDKNGVGIIGIHSSEESVEDYYLQLVREAR